MEIKHLKDKFIDDYESLVHAKKVRKKKENEIEIALLK